MSVKKSAGQEDNKKYHLSPRNARSRAAVLLSHANVAAPDTPVRRRYLINGAIFYLLPAFSTK